MLKLFGPKAKDSWLAHIAKTGPEGTPSISSTDGVVARVVPRYQHLGSLFTHSSSANADAAQRANSGKCVLGALCKHVLSNPSISQYDKLHFVVSFLVSRVCYASESWAPITTSTLARLEGHLASALAAILKEPRYAARESDATMRAKLGTPSVHCYIVRARLRWFGRVIAAPHPALQALLQAPAASGGWRAAVRQDLSLVHARFKDFAELGDPASDIRPWLDFVKAYPHHWRRMVRRLVWTDSPADRTQCAPVLLVASRAAADPYMEQDMPVLPLGLDRNAGSGSQGSQGSSSGQAGASLHDSAGAVVNSQAVAVARARHAEFRCDACDASFGTSRGLLMHTKKVHGERAISAYYVDSQICPCCKRDYGSRIRACAHAARSKHCKAVLLAGQVPRLSDARVEELSLRDAAERTACRRVGLSPLLAFAPVL